MNLDITFKANSIDKFIKYIDLDWARLKDKKKSINRYIFNFLSRHISHKLKQQATIALSSSKIKYMTKIEAKKEIF